MAAATLEEIEAIYRSRGADFFRLALARTADREMARDAVQEGFARAIRARTRYRGSGPLAAWLARCVLNATHDLVRRRAARDSRESVDAEAWTPDTPNGDVRSALRQLPARQRDALFLRFYLDFDYATIAETLGVEIGTVSATLHAARQKLAEALQEVPR